MANDNQRLLDMTPDELHRFFHSQFGADPTEVACPHCGATVDNVCETPSGRVTMHRARIVARGDSLYPPE